MNEPHFPVIRRRCAHLSESELIEAERRFAALLDVVAAIVDQQQPKPDCVMWESPNTRGALSDCAFCGNRENGSTKPSL